MAISDSKFVFHQWLRCFMNLVYFVCFCVLMASNLIVLGYRKRFEAFRVRPASAWFSLCFLVFMFVWISIVAAGYWLKTGFLFLGLVGLSISVLGLLLSVSSLLIDAVRGQSVSHVVTENDNHTNSVG